MVWFRNDVNSKRKTNKSREIFLLKTLKQKCFKGCKKIFSRIYSLSCLNWRHYAKTKYNINIIKSKKQQIKFFDDVIYEKRLRIWRMANTIWRKERRRKTVQTEVRMCASWIFVFNSFAVFFRAIFFCSNKVVSSKWARRKLGRIVLLALGVSCLVSMSIMACGKVLVHLIIEQKIFLSMQSWMPYAWGDFFCCAIREVPLNNLSSTPISFSAQQSQERKNLSKRMWKFKEKSERKYTRNSIKFDPIITSHDERNLKLYCRLQTRIWANDNGSAIMQISSSHIWQRLHNFPEKKLPFRS